MPGTTLWIDVEDLFEYAAVYARPSGIQRVEFELCRELAEAAGTGAAGGMRVRFVRHAKPGPGFRAVPWAAVERLFGDLTADAAGGGPRGGAHPAPAARPEDGPEPGEDGAGPAGALRRAAHRLPMDLRYPLAQGLRHQQAALRHLRDAARRAAVLAAGRLRRRPPAAAEDPAATVTDEAPDAFDREAAPGDVLAVLGSPWFHADYAALVRHARGRGLRFALMVFDLIPLRRPEWCDRGLVRRFRAWFAAVLPLADAVLTISRASAADVARHCAEAGIALRAEPRVVPMGTGFGAAGRPAPPPGGGAAGRALPEPGGYALVVSTIEARKNHALLFRVWRRLLEEHPRDAVPTLVFAGRVGWLVADLMQQLRNAEFLGGKIVHVDAPTDAELGRLYAGCRFTLFPSFYEGWGLPVTESLAFGAPCIASNATSLPEAGGALARYFDPEDATEAYRLVEAAIRDPAGLAAWRERVGREFRPVPWREAAEAVLRAVRDGG